MPHTHEPDIARLYHINSANVRCRISELTVDYDRQPARFRTYPGSHRVDLPGRDFELDSPLGDLLERRRSIRKFALKPLSLTLVGRLLYASYGVRGYQQVDGEKQGYDRPAPSAGGLYPLELYVASQSVEGLPDGIYHFDARANQLELRRPGLFHTELADMTIGQNMIRDANLVIMIAALFDRTIWKYGQRGYRYVWLDAGHLGENLYLVSRALGLGPVAIGGFYDDEVNSLLDLPPGEETIYMFCVGQPQEAHK